MPLHATRIRQGEDLRLAIADLVAKENISAGAIISAVGSLSKARIRMAGATVSNQAIHEYEGPFEIVSLIGTVGNKAQHLHISISDIDGRVIGGHLKDGCIVHTTVELVILSDDSLEFSRKFDSSTGFDELSNKES